MRLRILRYPVAPCNISNWLQLCLFFTLPVGAIARYCDEYVCVCVCVSLSVCEDISGITRAIFTNLFMHVAYGCGSVLLWRRCDSRVLMALWMTLCVCVVGHIAL